MVNAWKVAARTFMVYLLARSEGLQRLQSALMFAALMTAAYLTVSVLISAASCSGVDMNGARPKLASLSTVSGMARILATSVASRSTMALGVPGGARIACHDLTSKFGRPDSAKVGTFG